MTQIDQIIADALAGSPETHVAMLAREVVRLREAPAVVVPDLTDEQLRAMLANAAHCCGFVDYEPEDASVGDLEILREVRDDIASLFRAIPADRVLGEGVVALRRFAERCAQRDHQPDEHIGRAKCVACEAEDALRANQGADHD